MAELTILTRGQEKLYKFVLFSTASVENKLVILDRMIDVFRGADDRRFLHIIKDSALESGEIVSYEYLVEHDFPYHLGMVEGESFLSTAEAHATLVSETKLAEDKEVSQELMAISRHLLECPRDEPCPPSCPIGGRSPVQSLDRLSMSLAGSTKVYKPLSFREIYEERKNRSLGAKTFIRPFDEKTQGLEPGTLAVVAGFTGSYKTTFALNMAHQNAIHHGYNTVFITSEIPKEILYLYLMCRHSYEPRFSSHGPVHRLDTQKAQLTEREEEFVREEVEPDLLTNPDYGKIEIMDTRDFHSFTYSGIKSRLLSLPFEVDLLAYDYIQLTKFLDEAQEFRKQGVNAVNAYVRVFSDLAMHMYDGRHQLVSLLLSQINREGWKEAKENDGEYELTALAEANELEKSAYYVITLFSDEDLKESGELKAQLLKHRGGETQQTATIIPVDSRYLALGHGIEGFGEEASTDMSSLLTSGGGSDLFGGF